jgi:hypothetical protein
MTGVCGGNLQYGILCAVIFPVVMLFSLFFLKKKSTY